MERVFSVLDINISSIYLFMITSLIKISCSNENLEFKKYFSITQKYANFCTKQNFPFLTHFIAKSRIIMYYNKLKGKALMNFPSTINIIYYRPICKIIYYIQIFLKFLCAIHESMEV